MIFPSFKLNLYKTKPQLLHNNFCNLNHVVQLLKFIYVQLMLLTNSRCIKTHTKFNLNSINYKQTKRKIRVGR